MAIMDDFDFDTTPVDEECEQMGPNYNPEKARFEAACLIGQLRRHFGAEPEGARLRIRENPHDFGTYLSVQIRFDEQNEAASNYAYGMEANFPTLWDDEARKLLIEKGYLK